MITGWIPQDLKNSQSSISHYLAMALRKCDVNIDSDVLTELDEIGAAYTDHIAKLEDRVAALEAQLKRVLDAVPSAAPTPVAPSDTSAATKPVKLVSETALYKTKYYIVDQKIKTVYAFTFDRVIDAKMSDAMKQILRNCENRYYVSVRNGKDISGTRQFQSFCVRTLIPADRAEYAQYSAERSAALR